MGFLGRIKEFFKYIPSAQRCKKNAKREPFYNVGGRQISQDQYLLATYYLEGRGVFRSKRRAAYWMEKSASTGYDLAQYHIAKYYEQGCGVNEDKDKAFYWYFMAAERGHGLAAKALGDFYVYYRESNYDLALRAAASRGIDPNNEALKEAFEACAYADFSDGIAVNAAPDSRFAPKSAGLKEQDLTVCSAKAQYLLGHRYRVGEGTQPDLYKALHWLTLAARLGNAEVQLLVASEYYDAQEIKGHLDRCKYWLEQAAKSDDPVFSKEAKKKLKEWFCK